MEMELMLIKLQLLDFDSHHSGHGELFIACKFTRAGIDYLQILTGILRHYATVLMATTPKKQELPAIKEQRSLLRGINLRANANVVSPSSFQTRKDYLVNAYESGAFLKEPEKKGQAAPNPMSDPAAMEGMMGMMKGNMAMMIPQTLIRGWINAFFSGFVISTC
jgi:hypothetical protein